MNLTAPLHALLQHEGLNYILTNRIPRWLLSRVVGRVSRSEHPVVRNVSLALWRLFGGDLHLEEARTTRFPSLHACFIRELRPGARPVDDRTEILVSPCDGIVMAAGTIRRGQLLQAKGLRYTLEDLLAGGDAEAFEDGTYVTLRLTSTMYHRFHAPDDLHLASTAFVPGDLFNVNPPSVRRIPRLYCRNERAILRACTAAGESLALVAVGAVLVGSIHVHAVGVPLSQEYGGPYHLPCDLDARRGEELGYFHHGSTIIVLAEAGLVPAPGLTAGTVVRMGQALLVRAKGLRRHGRETDGTAPV